MMISSSDSSMPARYPAVRSGKLRTGGVKHHVRMRLFRRAGADDRSESAPGPEGEEWPEPPRRGTDDGTPKPEPEEPARKTRHGKSTWEFEEGDEIAPGRTTLKGLGGGNRYEVYLVWDEGLFAICVAKILRPDQVDDDRALRELRLEAELLESIAHPVIVRGFDLVADGPHPHLMIEHFEGPSLRRLIKKGGPLPLSQLLPLALHVAGALQYLANNEIVHLDVKPDNLIMGIPPRLIDMSIARSFERAARTKGTIGTDAYMAPEQCGTDDHRGQMGAASDVWGLGATLYHCASGRVPFPRSRKARESEDPAERFPQLGSEPDPLPDSIDSALGELILATLRRDPVQRPTAAEVAERLEPFVAELPSRLILAPRGTKFK
jgi:eukaryotic-like serine/threonine-protein kinase